MSSTLFSMLSVATQARLVGRYSRRTPLAPQSKVFPRPGRDKGMDASKTFLSLLGKASETSLTEASSLARVSFRASTVVFSSRCASGET